MNRFRIEWRQAALGDLESHAEWLSQTEHGKPEQTIRKIRSAVDSMKRLGDIGRPGIVAGTRELSVRDAPYVVVYRRDGDALEVLAVFHMAQER